MQLRYRFRLEPTAGQRVALARMFGCARVVYNDGLQICLDAAAHGARVPTAVELSKLVITEAKKTPERAWLGDVSAAVLQQSVRDLGRAWSNHFASRRGTRKGPRMGKPAFKSRKDSRFAIRFARNTRFRITDSGRLRLPGVGEVRVRWSRGLPSEPSSVTVIKDAADRYFCSFVVVTHPAADLMPDATGDIGIDLGLTRFAVLSDGSHISSPRYLRRAEKKLQKRQRELSRKQKGSKNRDKARIRFARAHAKVADARRNFHHQWSHKLTSENCENRRVLSRAVA
ncbi:RNA-guided endonuclease InsQ/TnpB family protein [Kitasatospora sp. NPDC053057]|uniref:RNA-guided endonuclease InsQ/TnpB family protein n=1 Tax=Kitasatospora sp. NPDC053057 TaxID=3364062 RepID=UPI0037C5C908